MQRAIVVLPLPDSPTRATHSPEATSNETSSAATTVGETTAVLGPQALDREQRLGGACRSGDRALGQLESRSPAPLEAAHAASVADLLERRQLGLAAVDLLGAAGSEGAACRVLADPGRDPRHAAQATGSHVIGDRCDEAARVGVPGLGEHGCRGPLLDDPSCVHDGDPVRHLRHHREVVRHVDHGQPSLAPQPGDLLEHARLGHDVEPGGGLVEHDERRLADERDRDRDSLLLPAGELVRVALNELVGRRQVDAGQRRFHGPRPPGPRACSSSMSRIARPMRSAGLSEAPGSCGT